MRLGARGSQLLQVRLPQESSMASPELLELLNHPGVLTPLRQPPDDANAYGVSGLWPTCQGFLHLIQFLLLLLYPICCLLPNSSVDLQESGSGLMQHLDNPL